MSINIETWGTHTVSLPLASEWGWKAFGFRCPHISTYVGSQPSDTNSASYKILGERLNSAFASIAWRRDENPRNLYRGLSVPKISQLSNPQSKAVSTAAVVLLDDFNSADGSLVHLPFRVNVTFECPWDYPGMTSDLFYKAFEYAIGLALSNPQGYDPVGTEPDPHDGLATEDRAAEMFQGDIDPKSNELD